MMPVLDRPTIQYVVEEAVNAGIDDILLITGRGKQSIERHFDKSYELEQELKSDGKGRLRPRRNIRLETDSSKNRECVPGTLRLSAPSLSGVFQSDHIVVS